MKSAHTNQRSAVRPPSVRSHVLWWILLSLLAGVLMNVLLAAILVVVGHLFPGERAPLTVAEVRSIRAELGLQGMSSYAGAEARGRVDRFGYSERRVYSDDYPVLIDRWTFGQTHVTLVELEVGWPMKSFKHRMIATEHVAGIGPPSNVSRRPWEEGRRFQVPTEPMWPGVFLNSFLFAAVCFICILWLRFRPVRRSVRLRRGLCPSCAYPIGVSDCCTECGEPVPEAAGRQVPE